MKAEDLILISVDDHICEPADMFERHVPSRYRDKAPVVRDFLWRAEHVHERHSGWTQHYFPEGMGPSQVFLKHVLCCFISDPIGIKLLDEFNLDNVCWECDYPHSDTSWPESPEELSVLLGAVDDADVNRITHENAMRHYQFDPFATRPKERCTVAALRSEATDVDTTTRVGRLADERDRAFFAEIVKQSTPAEGR